MALSNLATAIWVYAVALSAALDGPADWSQLRPLVLPYPPCVGLWWGAGELIVQPGVMVVQADLQFRHPDGAGPLSCAAVAFLYPTDPPTLLDVVKISTPRGTQSPGELLSLGVTLVAIAPGGGE